MALTPTREKVSYISISSDAKLRKVVPAGTPGAVARPYETKEKDADGNFIKGVKIEKHYESVSGKITDIKFVDTEFGTLLQVTVTDPFLADDVEVLSMSTSQSYAQDFMTKLPNINLSEEIVLKPFCFTPEGGKRELKGITVTQNGQKVEKSFRKKTGEKNKDGFDIYTEDMGMPSYPKTLNNEKNEMKKKEGQKRYYKDVEIFLVDYTTEHFATKKGETVESLAEDMDASKDF